MLGEYLNENGKKHLPFDRALEVGLADRAVVQEYCGAGTKLFCQEPRGHLLQGGDNTHGTSLNI